MEELVITTETTLTTISTAETEIETTTVELSKQL